MNRVKKGDTVVIIAGRYRGQKAKVLEVNLDKDRIRVEGVDTQMVVKRHVKGGRLPNQPESGIVEKPATVHVSNVQPFDAALNKGVRVSYVEQDGKKVRKSRSSETRFD
jgi:large subunit ribosomal protein L24